MVRSVPVGLAGGGDAVLIAGEATVHQQDAVAFVTIQNSSASPVQIVAATSTDAKSVSWTVTTQVVSLDDLFAAGSTCTANASSDRAANEQARGIRELIVPAHGTTELRSGAGSVTFSGVASAARDHGSIGLDLYLTGPTVPAGAKIASRIPLR
jgi:copper(I)-binding protein